MAIEYNMNRIQHKKWKWKNETYKFLSVWVCLYMYGATLTSVIKWLRLMTVAGHVICRQENFAC